MATLKFIVDECVGSHMAKWLAEKGYDVTSVIADMKGWKDTNILDKALAENRIIITSDKDFGDIVFHKKAEHAGIILIRLANGTPANRIKAVEHLLNNYLDQLENHFIVISEMNVRVIKPTMH